MTFNAMLVYVLLTNRFASARCDLGLNWHVNHWCNESCKSSRIVVVTANLSLVKCNFPLSLKFIAKLGKVSRERGMHILL